MRDILSKYGINIAIFVVLIFSLILTFLGRGIEENNEKDLIKQMKEESVRKEKAYKANIDTLLMQIADLEEFANRKPEVITKIQTQYEARIDDINRITDDSIYNIWAERYGQ